MDSNDMQDMDGKSEISESEASAATKKCGNQVHWSDLPSLPLENIYSFLEHEDQVRMSLVCRKWSIGYGSPALWKKFKFVMTESQLSANTCPLMKFVRKYGAMFQDVEIANISVCAFNEDIYSTWGRYLILFLEILTSSSQLISFNYRSLGYRLGEMNESTNNNINRAMAKFLESQYHLKKVEFHYCVFGFQEGAEILTILTRNNKETLNHLVVLKFFRCETYDKQQVSNSVQKLPRILDFPRLTNLETDYSLVFEYLLGCNSRNIEQFEKPQAHVLSKLLLRYYCDPQKIEFLRGLISIDWQILKKLCPDLNVELNFMTVSGSLEEMRSLIVPHMPVTDLIYGYAITVREIQLRPFFEHLLACKTNDYLVNLLLILTSPVPDLDSLLGTFSQTCPNIQQSRFVIVFPINAFNL